MEFCVKLLSLPLWERGLKSTSKYFVCHSRLVAPLVGAWIEMIISGMPSTSAFMSLPLWERGLKSTTSPVLYTSKPSLPLWERGLKFQSVLRHCRKMWSLPLWERGLKFCTLVAFWPGQ